MGLICCEPIALSCKKWGASFEGLSVFVATGNGKPREHPEVNRSLALEEEALSAGGDCCIPSETPTKAKALFFGCGKEADPSSLLRFEASSPMFG